MKLKPDYRYRTEPRWRRLINRLRARPMATTKPKQEHHTHE